MNISKQCAETILPIEDKIEAGVYTRTLFSPADTLIVGAAHKKAGVAILEKGTIKVIDGENRYMVSAPSMYNTPAGSQKIGYALTDVVFTTKHNVNATTTEEAEIELFEETPQITRIRNSYKDFIQSNDVKPSFPVSSMPVETDRYHLDKSIIHGTGVFTSKDFKAGECIGVAVLSDIAMPISQYTNHSDIPNAEIVYFNGGSAIVALADIAKDNEVFIDYSRSILCQQQ